MSDKIIKLRMSCQGKRIPVRKEPKIDGEETRKMSHLEEFEAYEETVKGYYKLVKEEVGYLYHYLIE